MLARTAEDLYWIGRYIERAEETARLLDVTYHRLLEAPLSVRQRSWAEVLAIVGLKDEFEQAGAEPTGAEVADFLVEGPTQGSITSAVEQARDNARGVREQLPVELWEAINSFRIELIGRNLADELRARPHELYRFVRRQCQSLVGVAGATWPRTQGWSYFTLGLYLERAEMTTRLVRTRHPRHVPDAPHEWTATLRAASALQAHRRRYQRTLDPTSVIELLVLADDIPRAVLFCLLEAERALGELSLGAAPGRAARLVGRLRAELEFSDVGELVSAGVEEYLRSVEARIRRVNASLAAELFLLPIEHGLHSLQLGAVDSVGTTS